jgi:hypothetical protein
MAGMQLDGDPATIVYSQDKQPVFLWLHLSHGHLIVSTMLVLLHHLVLQNEAILADEVYIYSFKFKVFSVTDVSSPMKLFNP